MKDFLFVHDYNATAAWSDTEYIQYYAPELLQWKLETSTDTTHGVSTAKPESELQYDEKVDIYALGIILWQMFSRAQTSSLPVRQLIHAVLAANWRPPLPPPSPTFYANNNTSSTNGGQQCPFVCSKLMQACWAYEADLRPSAEKIQKILSQPLQRWVGVCVVVLLHQSFL